MICVSKPSVIAGTLLLTSHAAVANTTNQEIAELKRRIDALEQSNASQGYSDGLNWSGALELEADYLKDYDGKSSSDLVVATAFLAVEKQLQTNLVAGMSFLYEEDDTPFDLDEAYLSYGLNNAFAVTGGQIYLPFGQYQTSVISDPLTLELGETLATAAMLTYAKDDYELHAYIFRGNSNTDGDAIESFGGRLQKNFTYQEGAGLFSLDFINNLLGSDSLSDAGIDFDDRAAGIAAAVHWENQAWGASAEYLSALVDIDSETPGLLDNEKPAALQLECFFNQQVKDYPVTFAASVQHTKDALLLNLPERRWVLSAAAPVFSNVAISAQLFADEDYGRNKSMARIDGSGDDARGLILQVAAEL